MFMYFECSREKKVVNKHVKYRKIEKKNYFKVYMTLQSCIAAANVHFRWWKHLENCNNFCDL